jgi:hypothetical protein
MLTIVKNIPLKMAKTSSYKSSFAAVAASQIIISGQDHAAQNAH